MLPLSSAKNFQALILGMGEYVNLIGKKNFANVIKDRGN